MTTTLILSIGSDIGNALAQRRIAQGARVLGTVRTRSDDTQALEVAGATLVDVDFGDPNSVEGGCQTLLSLAGSWDELVVAPGTLEPMGLFSEIDFTTWSHSLDINLIGQLQALHILLPGRLANALVLFFAGGGTNNAPRRTSAYTLSKIALIKMTELLQNEISDARFCILGPGWVKTKIHEETLHAGERAGDAFEATLEHMTNDDFVPMETVLDCIDWASAQPVDVVGGRNFSVAHDPWRDPSYPDWLHGHPHRARLRRAGNRAFEQESSDD